MKKIVALTLVFMLLLSSVCLAFQPDPDRWGWIYSDDRVGIFYDKQTMDYYDNWYTCKVWLMKVYPNKDSYKIQKIFIKKNRTMSIMSTAEYDSNGKIISSESWQYPDYDEIVPDSIGEAIYEYFF